MGEMKVISFRDISACPCHSISAAHWIPEHHVEECVSEVRAAVDAYRTVRMKELEQNIEALRLVAKWDIEGFIQKQRRKYASR